MKLDKPVAEFWADLRDGIAAAFDLREFTLSAEYLAAVEELRDSVYAQWAWNYGKSPPYNVRKSRRIEGCGRIEILLDIEREGKIKNIVFYGDFFGNRDPAELAEMLTGLHLEHGELKAALAGVDVSQYFNALDAGVFLSLLLE